MLRKLSVIIALMMIFVTLNATAQVDILKSLPQDSDLILTINFSQLLSNPNVKKSIEENVNSSATNKKGYDEFIKQTGIDIYKDLDSAVIFTSGKVKNSSGQQVAGGIINGKFDVSKILKAIKDDAEAKKDVEVGKIGKYDAIIPKDPDSGYALFLDNKTLLLGSKAGVDSVLNVINKKSQSLSSKKDFATLITKLNKTATVAGAGILSPEMKETIKANPQFATLAAISYFLFDFSNASGVAFNFNAEVDDKKDLESVTTSINGILAMVKMFGAQVPELADLLNSIKVTSSNKAVQVSLSMPKEKLEELKKKLEERTKQMENKGAPQLQFNRE